MPRWTSPTSRCGPAGLLGAHHGVERAAAIHIAKGIPVAGGLAGGSADAAASLVALDRLWDLNTSDEDLLRLAADLGSDVPFALVGGTARGTGRGEVVVPIDDPGTWWWVVVPNATGMSTPEVYREYDRLYPDLLSHAPSPGARHGGRPPVARLPAARPQPRRTTCSRPPSACDRTSSRPTWICSRPARTGC